MPQSDQLHDAFASKNDDEREVNPVQSIGKCLRLVVVFHRHGNHVKHNDDHDNNVELLTCC